MIRDIAEDLARFIREDEVLHNYGHVTVVVEDKADVYFEISNALGQLGVCVLVAVTGFRRVSNSPVVQGTIEIQLSCYEHPTLNRDDPSTMTAQAVAERLARVLHYAKIPTLTGQILFTNFARDDVDEANIVRLNFEANTFLGYEESSAEEAEVVTTNEE